MSETAETKRNQWRTALLVTLIYVLGVSAIAYLFDYLAFDFFKAPIFYLVFFVFLPVAIYRVMLEIGEGDEPPQEEPSFIEALEAAETQSIPIDVEDDASIPPTIADAYARWMQDHPAADGPQAPQRPLIIESVGPYQYPDEVIDVDWDESVAEPEPQRPEEEIPTIAEDAPDTRPGFLIEARKGHEARILEDVGTHAAQPVDRFGSLYGNARILAEGRHHTMAIHLFDKAAEAASSDSERIDARMGSLSSMVKAGFEEEAWTAAHQLRSEAALTEAQALKLDMVIRLLAR